MKPTKKNRYKNRHKKPTSPHDNLGKTIANQHKRARKKLAKAAVEFGVAFLGSARTKSGDIFYDKNVEAAAAVASLGYPIIHGDGPGNMEASARGARKGGGKSIGLKLKFGRVETVNELADVSITFDDFSPRIDTFRHLGRIAMVFFPGGVGTLHEATSIMDHIMQGKAQNRPVIFFEPEPDRPYWAGFFAWLRDTVMARGLLKESEISFVQFAHDKDELVAIIQAQAALAHLSSN